MRRRQLLASSAAAIVAACTRGGPSEIGATLGDGPPEIGTLRMTQPPSICLAPQYLAEDLLKAEGFSKVEYVATPAAGIRKLLEDRAVDISMNFVASVAYAIDQGSPLVMPAGVHVGCFELFGAPHISSIRDLKGRSIAVPELGNDSSHYNFTASVLAHFGLDVRTDVQFVKRNFAEVEQQLPAGAIDGFLGFAPQPQELRAKGIGRVLVDSMMDRPWSNYYCCMITAHRDFVAENPMATLRATRAILEATDICSKEPERAARFVVDRGYAEPEQYDYVLGTIKGLPYGVWRELDPEDTVRFYSLRLGEAGSVKGTPERIIAQGTDWRFLRALKDPRR